MQDYYENVEWIINEATQKELKNTCMDFYRELCRWTNMEWSMDTIKPLKKEAQKKQLEAEFKKIEAA